MKWTMTPSCHYAVVDIVRRSQSGEPRPGFIAVRAIQEDGAWRVDWAAPLGASWLPWEPIDSEPRATVEEARAAIESWLRRTYPPASAET